MSIFAIIFVSKLVSRVSESPLSHCKMLPQMEQDAWTVPCSSSASSSANIPVCGSAGSSRFVPGEMTVESLLLGNITGDKRTDQRTTLQDDTSSQTSIRELKEEDLHFQVAYELNDEENETICFDCNKYVFYSVVPALVLYPFHVV